ncbi:hypothetical protein WJX82_005206 [Trebouxia sp. C0006]
MSQSWPNSAYHQAVDTHAAYQSLSLQRPAAPGSGDFVRAVSELPACLQPVFSGSFRYFNTVQSETFPIAYGSDINMVVAAPTGSGKTGVMELAILRLISVYIDQKNQFVLKPGSLKIVYLAPIRALVQEKVKQWQQSFGNKLGLICSELTGDTDMADSLHLDNADIICTTPEKFDAVTRRHKDQGGMQFFSEVALVLIDEVHLLSENRGSALETGTISRIKMVSSMKEMSELPIAKVRFVAVSATIPNIQDIADWLQVPPAGLKAFGEEVRPVKLRTIVKGYAPTKTDFLFERRLNDYIYSVVSEHSKGKPSLVFCSSRKGTVDTAMHLVSVVNKGGRGYIRDRNHHDVMQRLAATSSNKQLQQTLPAGIAFHNAGMDAIERAQVEELFIARDILVLCATSTLAMGVNLPAHLVVLKGTRRWSSDGRETAGYQEYDRTTCLQMIGRAGRPQFDTEGVAVIMTQKQLVPRYQNLLHGAELVESQLKDSFPEYLNAEIALRTVTDVSVAISWLKGSFFYIRVRKNPAAYGIPGNKLTESAVEKILKDQLILANVCALAKYGMVQTDEYGFVLEPMVPGQLMARHYIRFKTMVDMCKTPSPAGLPELLMTIAGSAEFSGIKLRRSEKKPLNAINKGSNVEGGKAHAVRFCVPDPHKPQKTKERIGNGPEKIFIMVNEALSDSPADLLDFSMKQELEQVLKVGERIALCMTKYFAHVGRLAATANSMLLHKALRNRMWDDSRHVARQLPGIGSLLADRLAAAGIDHLRKLQDTDPRRIETVTQRHYPFGNQVKEELRSRLPPPFSVALQALRRINGGNLELEITLTRESILPVGPAKGGKKRRKLVHTVCLRPDAPPSGGVQDQTAAGLPSVQPAGMQSLGGTQMPDSQTQGVSASGVRGYPANLLLHDKQAQQQASAPQSAHHYYHNLPDSVKYQPQITELGGPQADDLHSLPDFAGNSMGGGVMQKVSPQATSQTANFSRFNHSALPSSRKRSASQTPPDQQADPGAGQGPSGMFDFVRSKAKKLPGTTPGSSVSSSSIFGGARLPSPAPGILCRNTTTSSSPGLLSRLSESHIASRMLCKYNRAVDVMGKV